MRYRMLVIISTPRKGANISLLAAILSLTGTPALSLLFLSPLQCIHHHSTWPTLPWPLQPSPGLTWATCRLIADKASVTGLCWSLCDNCRALLGNPSPACASGTPAPQTHVLDPQERPPPGSARTVAVAQGPAPRSAGKRKAQWHQGDSPATKAFKIICAALLSSTSLCVRAQRRW